MLTPRILHEWAMRLAMVLAGTAVCLLVLEGTLRCLGVWHTHVWRRGAAPAQGDVRILCAGDSFTVGMGAPGGESYPAHLQRLLDACATGAYAVINAGVASQNTAQLLRKLTAQLDAVRPAAVVLLCGCANQWNKWGYGVAPHSGTSALSQPLYRLRVWKLAQRLWRDVRDTQQRETLASTALIEQAEHSRLMAAWHAEPSSRTAQALGLLFLRERAMDAACAWFEQAVQLDPRNTDARVCLAGTLLEAGWRQQAHTVLTNALAGAPHDPRLWYRLGLLYSHDAQHAAALEAWLAGHRNAPGFAPTRQALVSMHQAFTAYHARIAAALASPPAAAAVYRDPVVYQDYDFGARCGRHGAADWACDDVQRIIALCRAHGAAVFILTYPLRCLNTSEATPSSSLNYHNRLHRMLATTARSAGVPLVDVRAVFDAHHARKAALLEPENIGDHCTSTGYALLAHQVFAALCTAGLVAETNAAPARDAWLARSLPGTWRTTSMHTQQTTVFTAAGGWSALALCDAGGSNAVRHAAGSWQIEGGHLRQHVAAGDVPTGALLESALVALTPSTLTVRVHGTPRALTAERQP
jgi:tetratricopeptide (TPR) repeat protein